MSPVTTASLVSTARRNIVFENVLLQVREEDNDDNENLTDTICKDSNALQAVVAKIVPAENAKNTDRAHFLATLAEN